MPRKPREVKSTAPSPSPALEERASRSRSRSTRTTTAESEGPPTSISATSATDRVTESAEIIVEEEEGDVGEEQEEEGDGEGDEGQGEAGDGEVEEMPGGKGKGKMSMEERMAKLKDLRVRMSQSSTANRKDLVADHQKSKVTAKELARLEKQRKLAQTLRLKAEAEETGEDLERKKAWEWSIEQNERWEAKMEDQKIRGDSSFHNAEDEAHKLYNRNIRSTKADLVAYERQKEAALGLAPGTLVPVGATSASLATSSRSRGLTAAEDLYRGADTLAYGDSKPSEEAIDRVIGKINKDMDKGKRKKKQEDDGEVNYINDRNKVFNKKIARYFDKYTKEIRANFERGTAL